jgi:hypothetical protein
MFFNILICTWTIYSYLLKWTILAFLPAKFLITISKLISLATLDSILSLAKSGPLLGFRKVFSRSRLGLWKHIWYIILIAVDQILSTIKQLNQITHCSINISIILTKYSFSMNELYTSSWLSCSVRYRTNETLC